MALVTRRTWPLIQTRDLLGWLWAAIALIDVDAAGLDAGKLLHVGHHRPERVAVERIAVESPGMQHELPAFG
jgi:hypothetical protein